MNIFSKLRSLPNAPKSIFMDCLATPQGTWKMHASTPQLTIKIEISHCEFRAFLHRMKIEHDINCTEYSIEL